MHKPLSRGWLFLLLPVCLLSPGEADSNPTLAPPDLPADWDFREIIRAVTDSTRSQALAKQGPTHILAWKTVQDDRPITIDLCLVLHQNRP